MADASMLRGLMRRFLDWGPLILLGLVKLGLGLVLLWALVTPPATAQRRAADAIPDRAESAGPVPVGGGGGLIVGGISVETEGKTDNEARMKGWREAQRLAWPALWARLSGQTEGSAPRLPDSALDGMVSAIEVEREQLGGGRYRARLAVVFDRVRASTYLGRYAGLASSPPFLVLPVLQDAATRYGHEPDSPWLAAWAALRAGESPIDYVRIQPTPGDTLLLNGWVTERRDVFFWRMLVDRYAVADVLIPELILDRGHLGGPATALLVARFGPSGREVGRVRLDSRTGDLPALMSLAVREADRLYVTALRAGNLLPDPKLLEEDVGPPPEAPLIGTSAPGGGSFPPLSLAVATPDDPTLMAAEQALRAVPGVRSVRTTSYVLGGQSLVEVAADLSPDALERELDARGWRLESGPGGRLLRPRTAADLPLEAPAPPPAEPSAPAAAVATSLPLRP